MCSAVHPNHIGNSKVFSISDVEDWFKAGNELPTTPQLPDKQILAGIAAVSLVENVNSSEKDDESHKQGSC